MIWKILALFQAEASTVPWGIIAIVAGIITPFALAVLAYVFGWGKNRADIDKTQSDIKKADFDMAMQLADRAPAWMKQIEEMHSKSLDDETKLEKQEREISKLTIQCEIVSEELRKALEGEASYKTVKTDVKIFLVNVEGFVKKYPDDPESQPMIIEIHGWIKKLET